MTRSTAQRSSDSAPSTPAAVAPYVAAIGAAGAADLFLSVGGTKVYLSENPHEDSRLLKAVGANVMAALCRHFGRGHIQIPIAKGWVARQLDTRGWERSRIARALHVTDASVRAYLHEGNR